MVDLFGLYVIIGLVYDYFFKNNIWIFGNNMNCEYFLNFFFVVYILSWG